MPAGGAQSNAKVRAAVRAYLSTEIAQGHQFFKSYRIAKEVDATAKQVGHAMSHLAASSSLQIERWGGNSDGTTWFVRIEE